MKEADSRSLRGLRPRVSLFTLPKYTLQATLEKCQAARIPVVRLDISNLACKVYFGSVKSEIRGLKPLKNVHYSDHLEFDPKDIASALRFDLEDKCGGSTCKVTTVGAMTDF